MTSIIIKRIAIVVLLNFTSVWVWAGCSPYMGLASINEVSKKQQFSNSKDDYVEVKKLDNTINNNTVNSWTLEVCEVYFFIFTSCSPIMSLNDAAIKGKYWVLGGTPNPSSYIDWVGGFDVVLKDENGDVIDYVSTNGFTEQYESCPFPFPTTASGSSSTRRMRRQPDGVGEWDVPTGNSEPPTEGETNNDDEPPLPAGAPEVGFLQDVAVSQGQAATLTFQLNSTFTSDVTITFNTVNGTAVSGVDYTPVAGSVVIPAGNLSATIPVPTLVSGAVLEQYFFMTIEGAVNADVVDQVALVTIGLLSGPDHFSITHASTGINCEASTITIEAIDSLGYRLASYDGTINLSTTTNHGDWIDPNSTSKLTAIGADLGTASFDFDGTEGGFITLLLSNTYIGPIGINVIDDLGNTEFSGNAVTADDLPLVFSQSGFKFIYGNGSSPSTEVIPNQISGKPMNEDFGYDPLKVRAVMTDVDTGVCTNLFVGNKTVELTLECVDPDGTSCDTSNQSQFLVNGIEVKENASGYSGHNLSFVSNSTADLSSSIYMDSGKIRLHARYTLTGSEIVGSSFPFVAVPAGFCVVAPDSNSECIGTDDTTYSMCGYFKSAGSSFNINTSAQGWEFDGDVDFCDNNKTLLSFTGDVGVQSNVLAPISGDKGTLNVSSITLNSGTSIDALTWSEVGVLSIQAGGGNYFPSVSLPTSSSSPIGRFRPDNFLIQSISEHGSFDNGNTGFTYVGELNGAKGAISYLVEPEVIFLAQNALSPRGTVKNYIGEFNKLPQLTLSAFSNVIGKDSVTNLTISSNIFSQSLVYSSATYEYLMRLNSVDDFLFNRTENSEVAPFTNDVYLQIDGLTDLDGVVSINTGQKIMPVGGPIKYGRLIIDNVFGSEVESLSQSIRAQFFDGVNFISNEMDEGTLMDVANVTGINIVDSGDVSSPLRLADSSVTGLLSDTGFLKKGEWSINWSAPTGGRYGTFNFTYDAPSWLEASPEGNVSFGQFRGNDRVIYWKEINY